MFTSLEIAISNEASSKAEQAIDEARLAASEAVDGILKKHGLYHRIEAKEVKAYILRAAAEKVYTGDRERDIAALTASVFKDRIIKKLLTGEPA